MKLLKELEQKKLKTLSQLKKIKKERKGQKMVLASGCFDILHPDHIEYLAWAKGLGDYLIVAINSDRSVQKLKGINRPIFPLEKRVCQLAVNSFVDYLIVFNELDTVKIIEKLKPDIFARGKDCVLDKTKETKRKKAMNQKERRAVESYGGKIRFLNKMPCYSTSKLIGLRKFAKIRI